MAQIYDDIKKLDGEVLVVSFTPPKMVAMYIEQYPQPFPVVSDPSRAAYLAFALSKTSPRALLRPGVIWHYLRLIFLGWIPKRPDKDADLWQLGGDFIIDREGRLRYSHPSEDPADRPSRAELLEVMTQLGKPARERSDPAG